MPRPAPPPPTFLRSRLSIAVTIRVFTYVSVCRNSKKKLERMTIHGGDYGHAGQRSGAPLTLKRLKQLLEDDVANLNRMSVVSLSAAARDDEPVVDQQDMSEEEFDIVTDREKLFRENWMDLVPREGLMYDVVVSTDGAVGGLQSVSG